LYDTFSSIIEYLPTTYYRMSSYSEKYPSSYVGFHLVCVAQCLSSCYHSALFSWPLSLRNHRSSDSKAVVVFEIREILLLENVSRSIKLFHQRFWIRPSCRSVRVRAAGRMPTSVLDAFFVCSFVELRRTEKLGVCFVSRVGTCSVDYALPPV